LPEARKIPKITANFGRIRYDFRLQRWYLYRVTFVFAEGSVQGLLIKIHKKG
jgi:hypothetical protein